MLILAMSLVVANAASSKWRGYGQTVLATAVSMPVTYGLGEALTGTSNQLVQGMLPSVLAGIIVPSTVSVGMSSRLADDYGYTFDGSRVFGQTLGLNVGLYAGGTALGLSTQSWEDKLLYGAVSALLLPIPSWIAMQTEDTAASAMVVPTTSGDWMFNASFSHRF